MAAPSTAVCSLPILTLVWAALRSQFGRALEKFLVRVADGRVPSRSAPLRRGPRGRWLDGRQRRPFVARGAFATQQGSLLGTEQTGNRRYTRYGDARIAVWAAATPAQLVTPKVAVARHPQYSQIVRHPEHEVAPLPVADLHLALDLGEVAVRTLRQRCQLPLVPPRPQALDFEQSRFARRAVDDEAVRRSAVLARDIGPEARGRDVVARSSRVGFDGSALVALPELDRRAAKLRPRDLPIAAASRSAKICACRGRRPIPTRLDRALYI